MNRTDVIAGQGRLADVLATRGGKAEAEAPFVIEHREALIYMLCEAAELEHGIMCQYLFAAFSLKQSVDEGLTAAQLETVDSWRTTILHVAAEEMLHLALVHNVLSAIGSAPHLGRPNLPAPAHHYPAGVNLTLVPFGEAALRHFMFLERPEGMELSGANGIDAPVHDAVPLMSERDIVPRLQDFATVGHLYRSIEQGLARLCTLYGERNLFIGPPQAQAGASHFRWPELQPVTDLATAQRALDTILEQGEGARGDWRDAHFGRFVEILQEFRDARAEDPRFQPARPVLFATARPCDHDSSVPLITDRVTARCVDLFNVTYEILLLALERYFAHTQETDEQLQTLADVTVGLMVGALAPLGQLITGLAVGQAHSGYTAGPSFELFYESDYLMPHLAAAWTMLEERLRQASDFARKIEEIAPADVSTRLVSVSAALDSASDRLAACFLDWGAVSRFAPAAVARDDDHGKIEADVTALMASRAGSEVGPEIDELEALISEAVAQVDVLATSEPASARRMLDGVLRALVKAREATVGDAAGPTMTSEVSDGTPSASTIARLTQRVSRLAAVARGERAAWLRLAAAQLARLEPSGIASTHATAARASADLKPTITVLPGGPYLADRVSDVIDWLGLPLQAAGGEPYCRCGHSSERPYCDGACLRDGFDDQKSPKRVVDRRDSYAGQRITVFDNRGICQHSGYCTGRLGGVFHSEGEPFVTPSGGRMDEIVEAVRACPSGALSYALGLSEDRAHVDHDGTRAPTLEVTRDGPYRVTGGIDLVDAEGHSIARADGSSREHYALCRCGHSQNKPFCSGMHWYVDFVDPVPAISGAPSLFEWAGGHPAFERLTAMFHGKLAPDDPLLSSLYATITAEEPRRLSRLLAWLAGAPGDCPGGHLLLDESGDPRIANRWVGVICEAAEQAGLPGDPEFRAALRANLELAAATDGTGPQRRFEWLSPPHAHVAAIEEPPIEADLPDRGEPVGFDEHIKPMFRQSDRSSMLFAFDLWSYEAVVERADEIAARLADGSMPCDGAWPPRRVEVFNEWRAQGMPASATVT